MAALWSNVCVRDHLKYNSRGKYNQIANYVFTEQVVNLSIKAQAPNMYMNKVMFQTENNQLIIGEIDQNDRLKENIKINCIPEAIFNMDSTNYDDFLNERRNLMAQKIRRFYENL